jgi:uncharacterized repeat protein (TIGR02543 family)
MMTKKHLSRYICLNVIFLALFACDGIATLFHGPKPEPEVPTFTITFDANGATGTAPSAQTVDEGTAITMPGEGGLAKGGDVFTGWNISRSGGGTTWPPESPYTVTSDQTFYAQWTDPDQVYTVTYNGNGGSGTPPAPQKVVHNGSIAAAGKGNLTNGNKNFAGWNTRSDGLGNSYNAGDPLTVGANITLYAQWVDPSLVCYTVTYYANGASGTPPGARTVNEGTSITLPDEGNLTYSGKTFDGWNTAANGSGTGYAAGTSFTVNGNTNLYAQWLSAPVTPPGNTLAEKLAYIAGRADDGTVYDIVVTQNEYLSPTTVSTMGRNVTVVIASADPNNVKAIQLEDTGFLFTIDTNITLKMRNIILKGISSNTGALVQVGQGGTLLLESGAKVTLNTNVPSGGDSLQKGGGVYINGGSFVMDDGGEISGNNVSPRYAYGGGIYVDNKGTALIRGGLISGNTVYSGSGFSGSGGGIYIVANCTVTMNGGIIAGNSATGWWHNGGGVYVESGGVFVKRHASGGSTSGIIYGSAGGDNANSAGGNGDALYRANGSLKKRNATLNNFDEITSQSDEGWE